MWQSVPLTVPEETNLEDAKAKGNPSMFSSVLLAIKQRGDRKSLKSITDDVKKERNTNTPEDESYTGASSVAEITDNDDDVFLPNSKTSDKPSQSKTKFFKEPLRENLFIVFSGLYGILIVVLGAVLPIAETFSDTSHPYLFEGFYIYLYMTSMAFLLYVYAYLLRRQKYFVGGMRQTLSSSLRWGFGRSVTGSTSTMTSRTWSTKSRDSDISAGSTRRRRRRRRKVRYHAQPNYHTGSFYLRVGAIGFGIGSMIHSGLTFGHYFEIVHQSSPCSHSIQAVRPVVHFMFTFLQMYFVFLNSKMCVKRYKTFARFGLMHMSSTNICVWLRAIVVETLRYIENSKDPLDSPLATSTQHTASTPLPQRNQSAQEHGQDFLGDAGFGFLPELQCNWDAMMGRVLVSSASYLYPCTIEYSLVCAGILYVMWNQVGNDPKKLKKNVDCNTSNSSRGTCVEKDKCEILDSRRRLEVDGSRIYGPRRDIERNTIPTSKRDTENRVKKLKETLSAPILMEETENEESRHLDLETSYLKAGSEGHGKTENEESRHLDLETSYLKAGSEGHGKTETKGDTTSVSEKKTKAADDIVTSKRLEDEHAVKVAKDEKDEDDEEDLERLKPISVDCSSSSRGLFAGLLLFVSAVVILIAFYVLIESPSSLDSALLLSHVTESSIYVSALGATLAAGWQMRGMKFQKARDVGVEQTLALISLTGLLSFAMFNIVAAIFSCHTADGKLTIVSNVLMVIQACTQGIFLMAAMRVTVSTAAEIRHKPGRQWVTFLLVTNFALWGITTFETQRVEHNMLEVEFYGPTAWSIFCHISVPLGIYYRFHSTVCLSNIWKNAWKLRRT